MFTARFFVFPLSARHRFAVPGARAHLLRKTQLCLKKLPEPHRELIAARYDRALSFAELAREAGHTEDQLRLKTFRIRAILRRCIREALWTLGISPRETPA